MLKVFAKILLVTLPALIAIGITSHFFSKGFIDYHYSKITGEGNSLIIGTSRASQGLIPEIIIENSTFANLLLNFAFTSYNSPYCEAYLDAIEKKLNDSVRNGIFILEIDPFALVDDSNEKAPSKLFSQQIIMHGKTNYEYLYRNVNPFYNIIINNNDLNKNCLAHQNGWLEVTLSKDSTEALNRAKSKLVSVEKSVSFCKISEDKMMWLEKTIQMLQKHGTVLLIRIPAWQPITEVENKSFPLLQQRVRAIASAHSVQYFDFTKDNHLYKYVDGNHLTSESARQFSKELNKIILAL